MVTATEAPALLGSVAQEAILKRFVREHIFPSRFINCGRNTRLSKCIGFTGYRGSGKSLAAAAMAIIDYMVQGYTVWSNMGIQYGLEVGGFQVAYASQPLDKADVLKLRLGKGLVVVDEVNVEFSEARRSQTNRNLQFNGLLQQLRKRQLDMIYTTQHEMWVDNRLRFQTDVFIQCQDVLLKPGNARFQHADFGELCEWTIYDMTGILGKGSYLQTQQPAGVFRFRAKHWWNTYDTNQVQGEGQESYGKDPKQSSQPSVERAGHIVAAEDEFGWMFDKIQELHDMGLQRISHDELYEILHLPNVPASGRILTQLNLSYDRQHKEYRIPTADLKRPETMRIGRIIRPKDR